MAFEFLRKKPAPSKIIRVRITRGTVARLLDGTVRNVGPGEEIDVAESVANDICWAEKGERVGLLKDGVVFTPAQLAAPAVQFVPPPTPEGLDGLPAEFRTAFDLEVERERLRFEFNAAWRARVNYVGHSRTGEEVQAALRELRSKEDGAKAALDAFDVEKLERALHAAGQQVIRESGELNAAITELHDTARRSFALRLEPLGLAEQKLANLFAGSANYVKFVHPAPPFILGDVKRAGGVARAYFLDLAVGQMIGVMVRIRGERARVDGLLAEARAEFAKTQKAVRKAA